MIWSLLVFMDSLVLGIGAVALVFEFMRMALARDLLY